MKSWLQYNDIEIYSTLNERKSAVTEIYKYMTSVSKNLYIDKLDEIANKYNNTYHTTIKKKPVDTKSRTGVDFGINNDKDPKFKASDHVRISKYKYIFAKVYVLHWSAEFSVIKMVENSGYLTYVISDLNG